MVCCVNVLVGTPRLLRPHPHKGSVVGSCLRPDRPSGSCGTGALRLLHLRILLSWRLQLRPHRPGPRVQAASALLGFLGAPPPAPCLSLSLLCQQFWGSHSCHAPCTSPAPSPGFGVHLAWTSGPPTCLRVLVGMVWAQPPGSSCQDLPVPSVPLLPLPRGLDCWIQSDDSYLGTGWVRCEQHWSLSTPVWGWHGELEEREARLLGEAQTEWGQEKRVCAGPGADASQSARDLLLACPCVSHAAPWHVAPSPRLSLKPCPWSPRDAPAAAPGVCAAST